MHGNGDEPSCTHLAAKFRGTREELAASSWGGSDVEGISEELASNSCAILAHSTSFDAARYRSISGCLDRRGLPDNRRRLLNRVNPYLMIETWNFFFTTLISLFRPISLYKFFYLFLSFTCDVLGFGPCGTQPFKI